MPSRLLLSCESSVRFLDMLTKPEAMNEWVEARRKTCRHRDLDPQSRSDKLKSCLWGQAECIHTVQIYARLWQSIITLETFSDPKLVYVAALLLLFICSVYTSYILFTEHPRLNPFGKKMHCCLWLLIVSDLPYAEYRVVFQGFFLVLWHSRCPQITQQQKRKGKKTHAEILNLETKQVWGLTASCHLLLLSHSKKDTLSWSASLENRFKAELTFRLPRNPLYFKSLVPHFGASSADPKNWMRPTKKCTHSRVVQIHEALNPTFLY